MPKENNSKDKNEFKLTKKQEFIVREIIDLFLNNEPTEGRNVYEEREFRKNCIKTTQNGDSNTNDNSTNDNSNIQKSNR